VAPEPHSPRAACLGLDAGLASSAGRSSHIGQGHHSIARATVVGVCVEVDLTAVAQNSVAVFVPGFENGSTEPKQVRCSKSMGLALSG
jgi:hypothetical protein